MKNLSKHFLLLAVTLAPWAVQAGTITLVGNGSGGGPIFVTSTSTSIAIGTQIRVGTFTDATALSTAINNFLAGSANYTATLSALNSNFVDLGTNVTNYGTSSQVAVGGAAFTPSSTQFGFNGITSLAINGAAATNYNTFNGTITGVNYSLSLGVSKNLYLWTAFNNELAIVRNADGTGTSSWITPASDLSGITMNLSGLQVAAGGAVQNAEVLLGTVVDYSSGSDLIKLAPAIPEPSVTALSLAGLCLVLSHRRKAHKIGGRI